MDIQPEELSKDKLNNVNKESTCNKKYEGLPEEVLPAKHLTLKEFS